MQKARRIAILAAWFASVFWYWRENVPLVPTRVIEVPQNVNRYALNPAGEIPLVPYKLAPHKRGWFMQQIQHGPIEFWSLPDGRMVRELFTADDTIYQGPDLATRDYLIRRNGHLEIYSERGDQLATIPEMDDLTSFQSLPRQMGVLIQRSSGHIERYSLAGKCIWTRTGMHLMSRAAGNFVAVDCDQTRSGGLNFLNWVTGEAILPVNEFEERRNIRLSPDGRAAAIADNSNRWSVSDPRSGEKLWKLPHEPYITDILFSGDGEELIAIPRDSQAAPHYMRWRTRDGTAMPHLSQAEFRIFRGQTALDGTLTMLPVAHSVSVTFRSTIQRLNWLPARIRDFAVRWLARSRYKACDNHSERLVGYFPEDVYPTILPNDQGFLVSQPGRLLYYGLPLRRNWPWLIGWLFIPPVGLAIVREVVRRGVRRWRSHHTNRNDSALGATR